MKPTSLRVNQTTAFALAVARRSDRPWATPEPFPIANAQMRKRSYGPDVVDRITIMSGTEAREVADWLEAVAEAIGLHAETATQRDAKTPLLKLALSMRQVSAP